MSGTWQDFGIVVFLALLKYEWLFLTLSRCAPSLQSSIKAANGFVFIVVQGSGSVKEVAGNCTTEALQDGEPLETP